MSFVLFAALLLAAPRSEVCPASKPCPEAKPTAGIDFHFAVQKAGATRCSACDASSNCESSKCAGKSCPTSTCTAANPCGKVTSACCTTSAACGKACSQCQQVSAECGKTACGKGTCCAATKAGCSSAACCAASAGKCQTAGACCQTASTCSQKSGACCQTAGVCCQSGAKCCAASSACCQTNGAACCAAKSPCGATAAGCCTAGQCCQNGSKGCITQTECCASPNHVAACNSAAPQCHDSAVLCFGAKWCGPCRKMAPVVARLKQAGFPVLPVDIDEHREMAREFNVTSIPSFVAVVNGREVDRVTGVVAEAQLARLLSAVQPKPLPHPPVMAVTPPMMPLPHPPVFAVAAPMLPPALPTAFIPGADQVEVLVRATYQLDIEKAEALAALLQTVDASIETMGTVATATDESGESASVCTLTVTATPEVQQTIGRFVTVVMKKSLGCQGHCADKGDCDNCGPGNSCHGDGPRACLPPRGKVASPDFNVPFFGLTPGADLGIGLPPSRGRLPSPEPSCAQVRGAVSGDGLTGIVESCPNEQPVPRIIGFGWKGKILGFGWAPQVGQCGPFVARCSANGPQADTEPQEGGYLELPHLGLRVGPLVRLADGTLTGPSMSIPAWEQNPADLLMFTAHQWMGEQIRKCVGGLTQPETSDDPQSANAD